MSDKPAFGLNVADLGRSIQFYRDQIGLDVQTNTETPHTAVITTPRDHLFLLAGPEASSWPELLADNYTVLKPGEKIFVVDPDFDDRLSRLSADKAIEFELIERPWGDQFIEAVCPDGYGVSLWMMQNRSRDEILQLVRSSRDGFRNVIRDLTP
jgi:catechol 2,3-dioxygenase-like lactoylglutathione lyase family enzyme